MTEVTNLLEWPLLCYCIINYNHLREHTAPANKSHNNHRLILQVTQSPSLPSWLCCKEKWIWWIGQGIWWWRQAQTAPETSQRCLQTHKQRERLQCDHPKIHVAFRRIAWACCKHDSQKVRDVDWALRWNFTMNRKYPVTFTGDLSPAF